MVQESSTHLPILRPGASYNRGFWHPSGMQPYHRPRSGGVRYARPPANFCKPSQVNYKQQENAAETGSPYCVLLFPLRSIVAIVESLGLPGNDTKDAEGETISSRSRWNPGSGDRIARVLTDCLSGQGLLMLSGFRTMTGARSLREFQQT